MSNQKEIIIRNSTPKGKLEISFDPNNIFQPKKCVCQCQPSIEEIIIELDKASVSEFTKSWDPQTPKKQFKLFYNKADLISNPHILKVIKITPVPPVRRINDYEISPDDVGKFVKLVQVQDGTYHYEIENNETDINETNDIVEEKIARDNPSPCEISRICTLEDIDELTMSTPEEPPYKMPTLYRLPVIIRNEASVQKQSAQNEHRPEPATPKSDQHFVEEMDVEVDAMEETKQEKNSPTQLQKQLAEVSPFHYYEVLSPPRTPMTKDMLNEEFKQCRISIGPNNTTVSGNLFHSINWSSVREATRKLLSATFPREVLASHSLTGKPSPAFRNQKPIKKQLNPDIVADIVHVVSKKCQVDARTVRSVITLKCADENKMMRIRQKKAEEIHLKRENKENFG